MEESYLKLVKSVMLSHKIDIWTTKRRKRFLKYKLKNKDIEISVSFVKNDDDVDDNSWWRAEPRKLTWSARNTKLKTDTTQIRAASRTKYK